MTTDSSRGIEPPTLNTQCRQHNRHITTDKHWRRLRGASPSATECPEPYLKP